MYFHNGPSLKSLPYFEKSLELDPSYEKCDPASWLDVFGY